MSVRFERRRLEAEGHILLIIPIEALRVGRERLKAANGPTPSSLDQQILVAARSEHGAIVRVSVFCGRAAESGGSWQFAEDLDQDETHELALHLVRSQLAMMRKLFLAGVCMHVRIDFGGREQIAFRRATLDVRRELEAERTKLEGTARELADLDIWLLRNFVFHFSVSVDRLIESTLNGNVHAIRQRIKQADRQRERLSPELRKNLAS